MKPIKQIYLDSDDDIADIISKLEGSTDSRAALVPPKRSTTLQSVVNLKLLKKAADTNNNELVLITKDPAILNVASQLKILTAKNLETEPSVPEIEKQQQPLPSTVIDGSEVTDNDLQSADKAAAKVGKQPQDGKSPSKPGKGQKDGKNRRVPDFDRFKKYLLFGVLGLLIVGGIIWALVRLPGAEVTIHGLTQEARADTTFSVDPTAEESDIERQVLAADIARESRTLSTTFDATGTETVGEHATGQVTVTNCESTSSITVASGATLTAANGRAFRATSTVTVPGSNFSSGGTVCAGDGQANVPVEAEDIGSEYNLGPTSYTVAGYSPSNVSGQGGNMTGGSSEEVSVVSSEDVSRARERLLAEERSSVEAGLRNQFANDQFIIEASLNEDITETTSEPAVGGQTDNARLILQVTYTLIAVGREDMEALLVRAYLADIEEEDHLGVVDSGLEQASIRAEDDNLAFSITANGMLGPDIDEDDLKEEIAGVAYNEAIEIIESKPNVTRAEIELSPFWASSIPSNSERITIEFDITGIDEPS